MRLSCNRPYFWRPLIAILFFAVAQSASSGDDASGPISYSLDLSVPFTQYEMTDADFAWSKSLTDNLGYKGETVYFVLTSVVLEIDGNSTENTVYKAVLDKDVFYVAAGDTMLKVGNRWPTSPGGGGFSMHAPRSKKFVVCLNCYLEGVPHHSGTKVRMGPVSWTGHDYRRL